MQSGKAVASSELHSVTKEMDKKKKKKFSCQNVHIETNVKGRVCEFRKSRCHRGQICNTSQGHQRAKLILLKE